MIEIDEENIEDKESVLSYANLLSQYATIDEDIDLIEIFKVLSERLVDLNEKEFIEHEEGFLKIFSALDRHPKIGKLLLKFFTKNQAMFRDNSFYLLCYLMLCSIPRFQNEAVAFFSSILSKIWNFCEPVDKIAWLKSVIKCSVVKSLREKILVILEVIKKRNDIWFNCLAPGLQQIALELIQSESKKHFNIRLNEGRLQETSQLSFFGRRIFVELAVLNVNGLDNQLMLLINAVFASSNVSSIAYVLIDVLLELMVRAPVLLLNNWKIFEKLIQSVCSLSNSKISTALIRAIMPIINQRAQLRALLLKTMKSYMLSTAKMSSALPVILLLLKSLSDQPSVKQGTQISQSFATFSTQVLNEIGLSRQSEQAIALEVFGCIKRCINQSVYTKCLIYKGLIEICKKNSCFVGQVIDLLINDAESLPLLSPQSYIDSKRENEVLPKIPLAHITMALSSLIRISITNLNRSDGINNSACITTIADAMTVRAEAAIQKIIKMGLTTDHETMSLGANNDFSLSAKGIINVAFAYLMIDFYDVVIHHLWGVEFIGKLDEVEKENDISDDIANIIQKRNALYKKLEEKAKGKAKEESSQQQGTGDDEISTQIANDRKKMLHQRFKFNLEIDVNFADLDKMLSVLINKNCDETNLEFKDTRNTLLAWAIERIYVNVNKLQPFSTTCLTSMTCFISLAKSLILFYIGDELPESLNIFRCWDTLKTYALSSYANVIQYLITRYQQKCHLALVELLISLTGEDNITNSMAGTTQNCSEITQNVLDERDLNRRQEANAFNRILLKHLIFYSNQVLPALLSIYPSFQKHKMLSDFQRQALALLDLCSHLLSSFLTTNSVMKKRCFLMFQKLAKTNKIEDRVVAKELWRIIFNQIIHSDYGEFFVNIFKSIIHEITLITDLPEDVEAGYKSITVYNREEIMICLLDALAKMSLNICLAIEIKDELGNNIDDAFLISICSTTKSIIDITTETVDFVSDHDNTTISFMLLITQIYNTIFAIAKQLQIKKEAKSEGWQSVDDLIEIVEGSLYNLVNIYAESNMGASRENDTIADESLKKRVRKSKKDEKVFVNHERAFEKLQVQLIVLSKIFMDDRIILNTIKMNTMRDFSIDGELLTKRLERRLAALSNQENNCETNDLVNSNLEGQIEDDAYDQINENSRASISQLEDENNENDEYDTTMETTANNDEISFFNSTNQSTLPTNNYSVLDENSQNLGGGFCNQDESFETFCNEPANKKLKNV